MAKKKKLIEQAKVASIEQRTIKSFLEKELLEYGLYVIENRTMPNGIDGLRTGARKILYAAQVGSLKTGKKDKMLSFIGDVLKQDYDHGDASLMGTTVQLASKHVTKYAPLIAIGQTATLRTPVCTTAPRYLSIKKSPFSDLYTTDSDLFTYTERGGKKSEPDFMLPVLPMMLFYRTSAAGFGFGFRCFSYTLNSVTNNMLQYLAQGKCDMPFVPYIEGIDPRKIIYSPNTDSWYSCGDMEIDTKTSTVHVTDLPYSMSFDAFEKLLKTLQDKFNIVSFDNLSQDGNIHYAIKFAKHHITGKNDLKIIRMLNLMKKIPTDNINIIDTDGKFVQFGNDKHAYIKYFCDKRLTFYVKRKQFLTEKFKQQIKLFKDQKLFTDLVTDKKILIGNGRKTDAIKTDLDKYKIGHDVLRMQISSLTKEKSDELRDKITATEKEFKILQQTTIKDMFVDDILNTALKCQKDCTE